MAVSKEAREVLDEALAIGEAHDKERQRHARAGERLMVRAAENTYAVHLMGLVKTDGFSPSRGGEYARESCRDAARKGIVLSAKAYALIVGYSESYVSRLYRLGFGLSAGILDPNEKPKSGERSRWQLLSRSIGDTPEVGKVLGKDVDTLPTVESLDAAIEAALERKAGEREIAAASAPSWIPSRPSEQIGMMTELAETLRNGRVLTPRQIEQVRELMDGLREVVEEWIESHDEALAKKAS